MDHERGWFERIVDVIRQGLASFGDVLRGVLLSLLLLPILVCAVIGGLIVGVWLLFRPFFKGDRILFMTYFSTLEANLALTSADVAGGRTAGYWQSRLADLADARIFGTWNGRKEQRFSLAPLLAIEAEILADTPEAAVSKRFWALEERFERVVPKAMIDRWRQQKEQMLSQKDDKAPGGTVETKANAATLLARIHDTYLCNVSREKSVRSMKVFIVITAMGTILFASLLAAYLSANNWLFIDRGALVLVFAMGVLGAGVSVTRRIGSAVESPMLAKDAMVELSGFAFGQAGIALGMVLGGTFAVLVYFIFMGGDFQHLLGDVGEAMVPKFFDCNTKPNCPGAIQNVALSKMEDVVRALGLAGKTELAKLLVWSFLVGFSERLVPDMLDRLAKNVGAASAK